MLGKCPLRLMVGFILVEFIPSWRGSHLLVWPYPAGEEWARKERDPVVSSSKGYSKQAGCIEMYHAIP